jgi:hypothetical protein
VAPFGHEVALVIASAAEFAQLREGENRDLYLRAANETATEQVWLDVIARYPEFRFWVAQNKTVPDSILWILARDADCRVRSMLAQKRKLPIDLLEQLAKGSDESVRRRVALNPHTPPHILQQLSQDEHLRRYG